MASKCFADDEFGVHALAIAAIAAIAPIAVNERTNMLQRDYLVQMIQQFIQAIINSRTTSQQDPQLAADSLENAIGSATDIDGATLLSLGPESIASVMQLSGVDPRVAGYIAYSLQLEADYLRQAGNDGLAALRDDQARAVAETFMCDLDEIPLELGEKADFE